MQTSTIIEILKAVIIALVAHEAKLYFVENSDLVINYAVSNVLSTAVMVLAFVLSVIYAMVVFIGIDTIIKKITSICINAFVNNLIGWVSTVTVAKLIIMIISSYISINSLTVVSINAFTRSCVYHAVMFMVTKLSDLPITL